MRVALVCSLARGGPLEHSLVLSRALEGLGVEVRAACSSDALAARFAAAGADPVVAPLRRTWDVAGARRLHGALAGADIVHAQDRRSGLWTRMLPRRGARVYTVHGLPEPYLPEPAGQARPGFRAVLAYRGLDAVLARRRSEALIVPSRAVAAVLVQRLGFPGGKITVIPNGIEASSPVRGGDAVGTVSLLEPVKDLGTFLDAAALLAGRRDGVRFAVFGTGSQAAALAGRARTLGIADRVDMPGHVPAREALARLALLVLPSLMENSPMIVLEAMAAGVPVVATAVGGVPELAPPGTAQLVPPRDPDALADAIERLLADPEARRRQVAAARSHVEREHSAATMAQRTLAVYETVL
ncbi:MAG TPA: glycosyltransferase family 4 protein [Solirubrobacter sp.]|nr:glycosyltransferase family 4 protein [Solirubrobacter sp.]